MCLSASQILSTWLSAREELPATYRHFLDVHGGQTLLQQTTMLGSPDTCSILHPDKSCFTFHVNYFPSCYLGSMRVYLPLFALQWLFSKSKNPKYFVTNVLRSSFFLATYCTSAWMSLCGWNKLRSVGLVCGPQSRVHYFLHGWVAGLSLLVERHGRAVELATYCSTYAAETVFRYCERKEWISVSPALNSLILALSTAFLLHHYDQQPQMMIRWLFKLSERN